MSKTLTYKGYTGDVSVNIEKEVLYGKVLFISDLVTFEVPIQEELQKAFEEAVDDYLVICEEFGDEPNKPLNSTFNMSN